MQSSVRLSSATRFEDSAPVANADYFPLQSSLGKFRVQAEADNVSETFSLAESMTKRSSDMRGQLWCIQRPFVNMFKLWVGDFIAFDLCSGTMHGWVIVQNGTKDDKEYPSFKVKGEIFETALPKSPSVILGSSYKHDALIGRLSQSHQLTNINNI